MTDRKPHFEDAGTAMPAAAKIALAALAALLMLSLFYFKERMLFIDAPHILFRILNDGKLQITEHRYGSFITQLFPLLCARAHVPLRASMLIYSASFYLFYIAVGALLVWRYRQCGLAILLGLYCTLFVSDTFFWPNNEVHQGIAWLLLAFAVNFRLAGSSRPLWLRALAFTGLFFLAIWTHPLVMLAGAYLWFFFWADGSIWPFGRREAGLYTGILLTLSAIKAYYGMHHGYDSGKIEMVTQLRPGQLLHILSSPQLHFFIKGCITNYWLFTALFIAGMAVLISKKKWLPALLTFGFAGSYLLLVCITYWDAVSGRFYIESEYMPLSLICATPFVYHILPLLKANRAALLLALAFAIRIGYIVHAAPLFSNRLAITAHILDEMRARHLHKAIVQDNSHSTDAALLMNWGAPVESMLLSQLRGDVPQRTFVIMDTAQVRMFNTNSNDTLLGAFEKRAASCLNSTYFSIDTAVPYTNIPYTAR